MDAGTRDPRITITTGCFGNLIEYLGKDSTYQTVKPSPGWADIVVALNEYMKSKRDLLISYPATERLLFDGGSALPLEQERMLQVAGRNLTTGLPARIDVSSIEIRDSIDTVIERLIQILTHYLNDNVLIKPNSYIWLRGDLARISKLDQRLHEATGLRVVVE
jgi:rod shape-determining protein MreB